MTTQPEQVLENNLIKQLVALGYQTVQVRNEADMLANLQAQLQKHNNATYTQKEFAQILNHLQKGNVFEKAKTLRDKFQYTKDDGTAGYIEFMNLDHWCQNQFQVTQQVTMEGKYKNRYDVTLLINGLPLVQIELKRRGLELKEAFNQVERYHKHSYGASFSLYQYVQIFIISNGVNTKYFANNKGQDYKQTIYWSDTDNNPITQLAPFTDLFLEPCHISKMIAKYTVLNETSKSLMVLRPYQYYATEAIIERVKTSDKNGYIWHTTGSGKTLTSFKASQVLYKLPQVHKVLFVVDRKDLDYQTATEFNAFKKNSVDDTPHTKRLVDQLAGDHQLIVTTVQKLNNAITKKHHLKQLEHLRDKKLVLIFDECHRSQFGDTHKRITEFFQGSQMFGFTGTPIFAENAVSTKDEGKRTTKDLFEECLHKYVITDAIKDQKVLKFSVEYVGRYKQKVDSENTIDIEVEDIDTKELLESPERAEKIVDYIIAHHDRKTHSREFTAMFCVSSIDMLILYYELFKAKKAQGLHKLRVGTIFSYAPNEEAKDSGDLSDEPAIVNDAKVLYGLNKHSRDKLDEFIDDYNQMFGAKYSTKDSQLFYNYYQDIGKKAKNGKIDILLVVNMFLTGFDSKPLNTLYVDKKLRYHGLIQAYSRTNRIYGELKSQGNIVAFRNLKKATDEAIALFSNKDAKEVIFMEPYESYTQQFDTAIDKLKDIAPTVDSVNDLPTEEEELEFVKAFRNLIRLKNVLSSFADFSYDDLEMTEQEFEDYKSKYLDIYDKVRHNNQKESVSILEDVDFELELIHRDEVNVAYIMKLLAKLKAETPEEQEKRKKDILAAISGEVSLRSKKELIEQFINENLPTIEDIDQIPEAFNDYWTAEKVKAMQAMCKDEGIEPDKMESVISNYLFTGNDPLNDDVINILQEKPSVLQRKKIAKRVIDKVKDFVDTFINDMGI